MLELDHVFICLGDEPDADAGLTQFGLDLSVRKNHRGQGTRNACAFFDNAYLELLWRDDDTDLQSQRVRPLCLWERVRWRETGACPFGISFRPTAGSELPPTLQTWPYAAPFLPATASIPMITPPGSANEPLIFLSVVSQAPANTAPDRRPPLEHAGRRRLLTGVRLGITRPDRVAKACLDLCATNSVQLVASAEPHLELEWDGGRAGGRFDFGPALPLSIRW